MNNSTHSRLSQHCKTHENDMREYERKLWISFRAGSRESLNIIFERYASLLFSYGRNLTRDQELIADCIQDVFFELWTRRESLTEEIQSIKYYLFRCVRARIIRQLSASMRVNGAVVVDENHVSETEPDIEHRIICEEDRFDLNHQLTNSIKTLSTAQQEAIYLRFYEGMKCEEIANVMNTNVKAVYNLLARSLSSLRKVFKRQPVAAG